MEQIKHRNNADNRIRGLDMSVTPFGTHGSVHASLGYTCDESTFQNQTTGVYEPFAMSQ